ncbi:hypothetical protein GOB91_07175 [Sinorhizobium meliloti]|uniref:hypothetical protein n=1 Tax=Rhizobium meliloti TaxID=382 RepID=UPI0012962395|nr:hypothetical protein [Sinorhizobium meliloti]MDW9722137.1 hypothetical protein [Sinorhizobium meliloti]MDW9731365.1 hypothetical protein [Sinorhizobium meliloti]MDW9896625.1 hypothetical protein [Sinorhizobium meliloti]MDX0113351.1 hypothetical protein [Sinorhizobium meliloti]MQX32605.1 hypothetical protein [Sinorhizobium meliloti]
MTSTLSDAVDDLLLRQTQDPGRLNKLAAFCIEEFRKHGLPGVRGGQADEVGIRGFGRQKDWDLAYVLADKPRLLISLKSILKNLAGTVPNRLDDLMGEAANVQQLSPEVVIGYVVIMDQAEDRLRRDGKTWSDHFEANLRRIAIRKAPLWNQGLIEAIWLIRIDSRKPPGERIIDIEDMDAKGVNFFDALLSELYLREPTLRP